jgi:hypothetical protein
MDFIQQSYQFGTFSLIMNVTTIKYEVCCLTGQPRKLEKSSPNLGGHVVHNHKYEPEICKCFLMFNSCCTSLNYTIFTDVSLNLNAQHQMISAYLLEITL